MALLGFTVLTLANSHFLLQSFNLVFQTHNMTTTKGLHTHDLKRPGSWHGPRAKPYQSTQDNNCTAIVIASGQYALFDRPFSPATWFRQIKNIVDDIHYNSNMTIILRSIHLHSLGFTLLSCPLGDWRLPYLTEVFNEKLAELAETHPAFEKEQNMFIDTTPVVGAVWDTWEDWNHVTSKVGVPEARYILNKMSGNKSSTTPTPAYDLSSRADDVSSWSESGMLPGYKFQLLLSLLVFAVYFRMKRRNILRHC
jgi:hypothetical protein